MCAFNAFDNRRRIFIANIRSKGCFKVRGNVLGCNGNYGNYRICIPCKAELSHLKTYLSLEKMCFGDDLNIVYDIGVTDFTIPSLTVQPLVENAVKHGVGMKEDGGTVTISTKEYDDGVEFDTTKPNPDTSRTHLGIENIKERISTMCNGDVTIESEAGKGTVSTIKIFKDTKED